MPETPERDGLTSAGWQERIMTDVFVMELAR